MSSEKIVVVGARENNLKNVTVEIPRDKLVVITGLSGSGKSSLAFDTIYAEGQRRYVESLSAYARQFLGQMDKPDVDHIDGLSPAISIDQKSASKNPRSTVGTVTEIYDYLRILFARVGVPHCPNGHGPIERQSTDTIVDAALALPEGTRLQVMAPVVRARKGTYQKELKEVQAAGFVRVRVDGEMYEVTDDIPMDRYKQHTIEVVVDRIVMKEGIERRLADSVEAALKMGKGLVTLVWEALPSVLGDDRAPETEGGVGGGDGPQEKTFSEHYACAVCGFSMPELEPRMFSFNSPFGACPECTGLGTKTEFDPDLVIPDKTQPLRDGAIKAFVYKSGETKEWWPDVLDGVGRACGFDASRAVKDLDEEAMRVVWEGLPNPVPVKMRYGKTERTFNARWEGVTAILRKRYEQTESEWVKADLQQYMSTRPCPVCHGQRLKPETLSVRLPGTARSAAAPPPVAGEGAGGGGASLRGVSIADVTSLAVADALTYFVELPGKLSKRQMTIGERAVKEVTERLTFLNDVGLSYLNLDRNTNTLAGGEAQRIRLATQIGSGLMGCLYVLDEPSIGLHQRDNARLIETLKRLRDVGNTVLVVEHDEDTMRAADWLIDMGPGAGEHGGEVVNEGAYDDFVTRDSPTSRYLTGKDMIEVPAVRRKPRKPLGTKSGQAVVAAVVAPRAKKRGRPAKV
ncbi:MAG: excinuclease ABC subunit UvrA [Fimbriimonadaceae bacterium]|nr:excinuclease ABC subunit UvrA [Fimbriimonadaceae bacterium]QYK55987.1 MAG: excinuclease ABC subunit UvrA [Fimbriimonadaceae bacterium]